MLKVEDNLGLVRKVANSYASKTPEDFDDLFQVGTIGLIKAINRFDKNKGNSFSSYAVPLIKGEIRHYLRDSSNLIKVPRKNAQSKPKFVQADISEMKELLPFNREPFDEQKYLLELISTLDEKYQKILYLKHFKNLTYTEIAIRLHISRSTVHRMLKKGEAELLCNSLKTFT